MSEKEYIPSELSVAEGAESAKRAEREKAAPDKSKAELDELVEKQKEATK